MPKSARMTPSGQSNQAYAGHLMWCEGAKGLGAGQSGTEPMVKDMDAIADKLRWTIIARRALLGAAIR